MSSPERWFRFCLSLLVVGLLLGGLPPAGRAGEPSDPGATDAEAEALEHEIQALVDEGQFDRAAQKARELLELRQKSLPADDYRVADAKSTLGMLYVVLEDHARAEKLLRDAVAVLERVRPGQREHAMSVSHLARFFDARGQRKRALALHEQALELTVKAVGPDHADTALAKRKLALALFRSSSGKAKAAIELLQQARDTHEKLGDEEGAIRSILAIGRIRKAAALPRAETAYQEALDRAKRGLDEDSLAFAEIYVALAEFHRRGAASAGSDTGRKKLRDLADRQYQRAAAIIQKHYGPRHTTLADVYAQWSLNAQAAFDLDRAVELRTKANDIEDEQLDVVLAGASESVKLAYLDKFSTHAQDTVSMHYQTYLGRKRHEGVARLALTTVLRRKGRALDAVAENLAILRQQVGDKERALLDELAQVRAELAAAAIRGPGSEEAKTYKARVSQLEKRAAELEKQVAEKSAEYRKATAPVTLEAVQRAIPEDAALVEIVRMRYRDPRAYSGKADFHEPRYVAYVLRRTGPIKFAHLSEASTIDTIVEQFRTALADPQGKVGDSGWRLYTQTFARIKPLIGDAKHVLIAPDGALNLVPFGALVDGKQFLIQQWAFTYLSSGRDLLRFGTSARAHGGPLVVADPAFDEGESSASPSGGTRAGTLAKARFPALPGTRQEAAAIDELLPESSSWVGAEATEAALKRVQGPSILHVATHGFFLTDSSKKRGRRDRGLELGELESLAPTRPKEAPPAPKAHWRIRSPLLRSGVALAGANKRRGGAEDDGILTALEAAGMDLHGTQLVVLSACETGVGELKAGEGVFGLRRALVIAGSDAQVMSLWKVDDEATRDLMIGFYRKLLDGAGRTEAMRAVQLEMIQSKSRQHPFFWAAFIVSGNPGPLDLSAESGGLSGDGTAQAGGEVPPVDPSARGCACRVGPAPTKRPTGSACPWVLALAVIAIARRRQRVSHLVAGRGRPARGHRRSRSAPTRTAPPP